ncbi:MAG: hypothetical protein F7C33_05415 [Desulfurococcales archaeon]|nr:hypothetical protein [Desulfurococcales archaeon]
MRPPTTYSLLALAAVILLFTLKPLGAPYAIAVSTTKPVQGSLLLLEKKPIHEIKPGDCVLYCWDKMRTSCIQARIMSGGRDYLVGAPLHPGTRKTIITGGTVYRVAISIPLEVWLPLLTLVAAPLAIIARRLSPSTAILLAIILLDSIAVGGAYVDNATPAVKAPSISLEKTLFDVRERQLIVVLASKALQPNTATCVLDDGEAVKARIESTGGSTYRVIVPVTLRDLEYLYHQRKGKVEGLPSPPARVVQLVAAKCAVSLDIGELRGSYSAGFYWSDLMLMPKGKGVLIVNPNPIPFNATVTIIDSHGEIIYDESVTIPGVSAWKISVPQGRGAPPYTVRVYYQLLGVWRSLQVAVGYR